MPEKVILQAGLPKKDTIAQAKKKEKTLSFPTRFSPIRFLKVCPRICLELFS